MPHPCIEPILDRGEHRLVIATVVACRDPIGQGMDLAPINVRQIIQHPAEIRVQLDSLVTEEPQGMMDGTARPSDGGGARGIVNVRPRWPKRRHDRVDIRRRQGPQQDFLAA